MTESAEFIGGPRDGEIHNLCGLPDAIHVPIPPRLAALLEPDPADSFFDTFQVGVYRRDVISDDTHCWRYQWLGTR
jgi:hypothetical protein